MTTPNAKHLLAAAALAAGALTSHSANAQATTDSLAGWNVYGDAVSQGGATTVTTAFLDDDSGRPAFEMLFQDRAFAVINGQVFTLATASAPGVASQSFSYTFGQSGAATRRARA